MTETQLCFIWGRLSCWRQSFFAILSRRLTSKNPTAIPCKSGGHPVPWSLFSAELLWGYTQTSLPCLDYPCLQRWRCQHCRRPFGCLPSPALLLQPWRHLLCPGAICRLRIAVSHDLHGRNNSWCIYYIDEPMPLATTFGPSPTLLSKQK